MATDERAVITLSGRTAARAREYGTRLGGLPLPGVIRQGLTLLGLYVSLPEGAYLAVRNADGSYERVLLIEE